MLYDQRASIIWFQASECRISVKIPKEETAGGMDTFHNIPVGCKSLLYFRDQIQYISNMQCLTLENCISVLILCCSELKATIL